MTPRGREGSASQAVAFVARPVDCRLWGDEMAVFVPSTGNTHLLTDAASAVLATMNEHPGRRFSTAELLDLMGAADESVADPGYRADLPDEAVDLSAPASELEGLERVLDYFERVEIIERRLT